MMNQDIRSLVVAVQLRDRATPGLQRVNQQMDRTKAKAANMQAQINRVAPAMQTAGMAATGFGLAASAGAAAGVAAFAEFDEELANVQKTTGMTDKAIRSLGEGIKDLSRRMPVAVTDLTRIAAIAGQLGVQGRENILSFTETSAKMATAFEMTAEDAARQMNKLANIYDIPIKQTNHLASAINHLGNTTNAAEAEILEAMQKVGGAGKVLGMTGTQTAVLTDQLVTMSASAKRAGTRLNRAFTKMAESPEEVAELTGKSTEVIREQMNKNFYGVVVDVLESLDNLESKPEKVAKAVDIVGSAGQKALIPLADNVDKVREKFKEASKEYEKGTALSKEYAEKTENLMDQLKILKNQLHVTAITVGAEFKPLIKDLVQWFKDAQPAIERFAKQFYQGFTGVVRVLTSLVSTIQDLIPSMGGFNARLLGGAAAAGAIGGPILWLTGAVLPKLQGWMLKTTSAVSRLGGALINIKPNLIRFAGSMQMMVGRVITALRGLSVSMLTNPITAALLGITSAVIALKVAWDHNFGHIREAWDTFSSMVGKGLNMLVEGFKWFLEGFIKPIGQAFKPLLKSLGLWNEELKTSTFFLDVVKLMGKGFNKLYEAIEPHIPLLKDIVYWIGRISGSIISIPIRGVVGLVTKFSDLLSDVRDAHNWIGKVIDKLGGLQVPPSLKFLVSELQAASDALSMIINKLERLGIIEDKEKKKAKGTTWVETAQEKLQPTGPATFLPGYSFLNLRSLKEVPQVVGNVSDLVKPQEMIVQKPASGESGYTDNRDQSAYEVFNIDRIEVRAENSDQLLDELRMLKLRHSVTSQ